MPQTALPLPPETALRLQIASLTYEQAQLQARLLQQDAALLLATAERAFTDTVTALLAAGQVTLPVPLRACTFDVEHACLVYASEHAEENPPYA